MNVHRQFLAADRCNAILCDLGTGPSGLEPGMTYSRNVVEIETVRSIIAEPTIVSIARAILASDGPLCFLSLTALAVEPGSRGMQAHVDYPHYYDSCPSTLTLAAQFVLSLDGTTGGAAPTWLGDPGNVVELEPGDLLAFPGTALHGVKSNTSARKRTNLLWSIGPAWVKPMQVSLFDMVIDDVPTQALLRKA